MTDADEGSGYRPISALPYWDVIGAFIDEAVADTSVVTGRPTRALYPATVAYVLWCWQTRGTPLDRDRIFRKTIAEEFIHLGMNPLSLGSKATYRATLRLMIETLNPDAGVRERRPLHRSEPTQPYTPQEVAALHSWAIAQGTARRKQDAIALLTLGLGAGLATRELLGVRVHDVDARNEQLHVIVWASRPRVVPVLPPWQRPLTRILSELDANDWLFRPGRAGAHPGQITDFLQRARTTLDVRPSRMRTTWLVEHLTIGTPPQELLRISGLKNLAALDKISKFTPTSRASAAGSISHVNPS